MNIKQDGIAPNSSRLLWAGFMAILAAGVGFGVRGGIIPSWKSEFGFSDTEIGTITGAMFSSFCFGIIVGGLVCDRIGYRKLVVSAFLFHVLSALVTFGTSADYESTTNYQLLYWGTFLFGLANGTLEAVANPLVSTLFPKNRTHYLNILHASWPGGLVIGGAIGWTLSGSLSWQMQLALFLIPTLAYGLMFHGQNMPKSEASQKGLSLGEMFKDVGIGCSLIICYLLSLFFGGMTAPLFEAGSAMPDVISYGISGICLIAVALITRFSPGAWLLFVLFIIHAMVGAVELGTDAWIQNITGNILTPEEGKILFVFTSAIMLSLRFCANFIEKRIGLSPVGILLVCSLLACLGLNLSSGIETFAGAMLALGVYAVGKTFFWPTMLAITGDRFPHTGAIAMSIMGGIGMMSAGLLGGPGLGYAKDRYSSEALNTANAAVYATSKSEKPSKFLFFDEVYAIDGKKLGAAQTKLDGLRKKDRATALEGLDKSERALHTASIQGDRETLVADSLIPATMAAFYLLLLLYFKTIGGYKPVQIASSED